jgi:enamine deaminase RidA (YjgF/YER057c/UK114 family)
MSQIVEVPAGMTMIHLAGQIADDRSLDLEGQARDVLAKIDALLAEAGAERRDIVSAMVWLADIRSRHRFNAIWDEWVPEGCAPARACVEARLAEPGDLVEIQVVAAR